MTPKPLPGLLVGRKYLLAALISAKWCNHSMLKGSRNDFGDIVSVLIPKLYILTEWWIVVNLSSIAPNQKMMLSLRIKGPSMLSERWLLFVDEIWLHQKVMLCTKGLISAISVIIRLHRHKIFHNTSELTLERNFKASQSGTMQLHMRAHTGEEPF